MIYYFNVRNDFNELKSFYLTADNHTQLYRRILRTYGITKDNVEILEEYEETENYGYRLTKSNIAHLSDKDKVLLQKAREIFSKNSRRSEPWKTDYFNKHKFKEIVYINDANDLVPLIQKYGKIKVYWELGDKRGVHRYYAMVK